MWEMKKKEFFILQKSSVNVEEDWRAKPKNQEWMNMNELRDGEREVEMEKEKVKLIRK